jgi:flagellar basal-body rod protein FlgB
MTADAAFELFLALERDPRMDIRQIPLFSLLSNRMSWLSARQSVLAENISNSDTPNYVARDLRPLDFAAIMRDQEFALKPQSTDARHIAPRTGFRPEEAQGEGGTPTAVVSIEQEMIKLSDTQVHYQTATNLYQKAVGMFRTALGTRSA